ncbi:MAG: sensor histidine kinase [Pseudomonadota bacterium]
MSFPSVAPPFWRALLPPPERGSAPYLYLVYLLFLFFHYLFRPITLELVLRDLALIAAFLPVYFAGWRLAEPWQPWLALALVGLGVTAAHWNTGAGTLFVYAAALSANYRAPRRGVYHVVAVLLLMVLWTQIWQPPIWLWTSSMAITALIGLVNVQEGARTRAREKLLRQQEEIEYLAGLAERERIARDLHDLLGHTLSLIALKAELARKLLERDPARAKTEVADIEAAAREALQEVREAVAGYRGSGLQQELKRVSQALQVVNIQPQIQMPTLTLPPAVENVLSFVLREAITNVIRHARARHCEIRLSRLPNQIELLVQDDGQAAAGAEGNGLRGMRERVLTLQGELEFASGDGHRIRVRLPLPAEPST